MQVPILFYVAAALSLLHLLWQVSAAVVLGVAHRRWRQLPRATAGASVVVAAHNEVPYLPQLVKQLCGQQYGDYEVIVVNDRSWDGSEDMLRELDRQHDRLKVLTVRDRPRHTSGKKFALTLGIKAAKHDLVVLTDADCLPSSAHWLESMVRPFQQEQVQLVLGHGAYRARPWRLLDQLVAFETRQTALNYMGAAKTWGPYMGVGRNLAYRKSFFLANGGFQKHITVLGGDDDLLVNAYGRRRNTALAVHPGAITWSRPADSWKQYRYQRVRHLSVSKHYSASAKLMLGFQHLLKVARWASLVALACVPGGLVLAGSVYGAKLLGTLVVDRVATRQLGPSSNYLWWPFTDVANFVFSASLLRAARRKKKLKWR